MSWRKDILGGVPLSTPGPRPWSIWAFLCLQLVGWGVELGVDPRWSTLASVMFGAFLLCLLLRGSRAAWALFATVTIFVGLVMVSVILSPEERDPGTAAAAIYYAASAILLFVRPTRRFLNAEVQPLTTNAS